nr:translation initiation factor IF-2-like [Aegilops tauschii subsp. strangulata]
MSAAALSLSRAATCPAPLPPLPARPGAGAGPPEPIGAWGSPRASPARLRRQRSAPPRRNRVVRRDPAPPPTGRRPSLAASPPAPPPDPRPADRTPPFARRLASRAPPPCASRAALLCHPRLLYLAAGQIDPAASTSSPRCYTGSSPAVSGRRSGQIRAGAPGSAPSRPRVAAVRAAAGGRVSPPPLTRTRDGPVPGSRRPPIQTATEPRRPRSSSSQYGSIQFSVR